MVTPERRMTGTTKNKAPQGQVTLVFTDVQGSTVLWEEHTDAMRIALEVHNEVLRQNLWRLGGYEVKTEGDAFMLAFGNPLTAVRWALASQLALLEASWPELLLVNEHAREERSAAGDLLWRGLRVRMGLHLGEPECRMSQVNDRMDYFGPMVNRSARVASAAHGGQIVVSGDVQKALEPHLESLDSPVCTDLGEHWLKGLKTPERLVQVMPAALAGRMFAAPRSLPPPSVESPAPAEGAPDEFDYFLSDATPSMDDSGQLHHGRMAARPSAQAVAAPPPSFDTLASLELAEQPAPPKAQADEAGGGLESPLPRPWWRMAKKLLWVAVLGCLLTGAYVTRDRWLPERLPDGRELTWRTLVAYLEAVGRSAPSRIDRLRSDQLPDRLETPTHTLPTEVAPTKGKLRRQSEKRERNRR